MSKHLITGAQHRSARAGLRPLPEKGRFVNEAPEGQIDPAGTEAAWTTQPIRNEHCTSGTRSTEGPADDRIGGRQGATHPAGRLRQLLRDL